MITKQQLNILCKNIRNRRWLDAYNRLVLFKKTFKRWPKHIEEYPKGIKVGKWFCLQKSAYAKGKLPMWRRQMLERIDFPMPQPYDDWFETYGRYKAWYEKNDRIPLVTARDKEERALAGWRLRQRMKSNEGVLSQEQISLLTVAGLFDNFYDLRWNEQLEELKNFVKINGSLPVGHSSSKHEQKLAVWRHNNYRLLKSGELPEDKANAFKNVIENASVVDIYWNGMFNDVVAFLQCNNRFPSKLSKNKNEVALAKWRHFQMGRLKRGDMVPERAARFTVAGLDKPVNDVQAEKHLEEFKLFVSKNNRLPYLDSENKHERSLAIWARNTSLKNSSNPSIVELKNLMANKTLKVDKRDVEWEKMFILITDFMKKNQRSPSAKSKDVSERKLGQWKCRQIHQFRINSMNNERVGKLKLAGIL
ncbi:MAG TPA: helicase associated domain-containing protein [Chitinispirillaceae bacterium]|nr:helicase associated domain-containing protein [Chitinispirillaceae bacterium]